MDEPIEVPFSCGFVWAHALGGAQTSAHGKRHFGAVFWHAQTCHSRLFSALFVRGSSDVASGYQYFSSLSFVNICVVEVASHACKPD